MCIRDSNSIPQLNFSGFKGTELLPNLIDRIDVVQTSGVQIPSQVSAEGSCSGIDSLNQLPQLLVIRIRVASGRIRVAGGSSGAPIRTEVVSLCQFVELSSQCLPFALSTTTKAAVHKKSVNLYTAVQHHLSIR